MDSSRWDFIYMPRPPEAPSEALKETSKVQKPDERLVELADQMEWVFKAKVAMMTHLAFMLTVAAATLLMTLLL